MYHVIKRLFDILASGLALIVLLPLWLIAIIGIQVSDPGPVFYLAKRVGKNNQIFKMYKFRSMRVDKNANEKSLRPDQDRIFRWGQFMRDTKIDELPQLLNVFLGQMSVIGPRPASTDQIELTRSGKYSVVSNLTPGLSSPSAIYDYLYGDDFTDEKEYTRFVLKTRLDLDLYYFSNKSILLDIKIIWWTIISIVYKVCHRKPEKILSVLVSYVGNESATFDTEHSNAELAVTGNDVI